MKNTTTKWLVAALAAAGFAVAVPAEAAMRGGHSGGGHWNGGHSGGGHWSGGHSRHWGGGHYYGRSHWYGPSWSFYWGVPLAVGTAWWWGYPYYYGYPYAYDYYVYPAPAIPESYPQGEMGPSAEVVPGPDAPTQGPLYMNYCESAKAYYPKVTQCAEGWRFIAPQR